MFLNTTQHLPFFRMYKKIAPHFLSPPSKASLVLEDGSVFEGTSFGYEGNCRGEVVFNTGMTGYVESLTDPSYKGQILSLTYPLIGNYGVPAFKKDRFGLPENCESEKIHASGLVVADYSREYSHWNAVKSLAEWLKEERIPAITGIDTRALTKRLREEGVMMGKIVTGEGNDEMPEAVYTEVAKEVSCSRVNKYGTGKKVVALIDCGAKLSIIRCILRRGFSVIRLPYGQNPLDLKEDISGVVISNGPGNPKDLPETVSNLKKILEKEIPTFGICLGNQILALAAGADTYKLKYGHRSQNQPATEKGGERCYITSQNHGYAVAPKTLPEGWEEWFVNANDGTNEGIRHKTLPFSSVQFHPEANPGPRDTEFLFDRFLGELK
jgi:carbamoyl-phosphate synthase small subunit